MVPYFFFTHPQRRMVAEAVLGVLCDLCGEMQLQLQLQLPAADQRLATLYFFRISRTRSSGIASTVRPRAVTGVAMNREL